MFCRYFKGKFLYFERYGPTPHGRCLGILFDKISTFLEDSVAQGPSTIEITFILAILDPMNGKTLRLLTSAKLLISFRMHLHSLKYLSSNNSNDGSNSFLNVDLEWQHFYKLFLHLKLINFIPLMTSMLLFLKNASLKIMNTVIFGSFHPF